MKNYLVGIPCYLGIGHTIEAIESVGSDVVIVDNCSEQGIKDYIYNRKDLKVITNNSNEYINPAWNQIMAYFLEHKEYDVLCIMNSDLILPKGWQYALDLFYKTHNSIPVPVCIDDKTKISEHNIEINGLFNYDIEKVDGGIAGIFICLTREQCEKVYPIPSYIKCWFGDNWIYEILRMTGDVTYLFNNLKVYHSISQNVSKTVGISQVIEDDKEAWDKYSKQDKKNRVEIIKNNV
jgi:hypothetical protein